jgi:acetyl esterase/lipase
MLARGYVVTATDDPGLGTAGPHPYLVGLSEGRAVLDSVRAARALPEAGAGDRFAVWGHSQGGHVALFAGELARDYAPDLRLVGIAAAAPATELAALFENDIGTVSGRILTAMTLWSWLEVFGAPLDGVVEVDAIPAVERLARDCVESLWTVLEALGRAIPAGSFSEGYGPDEGGALAHTADAEHAARGRDRPHFPGPGHRRQRR